MPQGPALSSSDALGAALDSARKTLSTESDGLTALAAALDGSLGLSFQQCVDAIQGLKGRVIATGMGKSGHVAQKIASTLASTGTPAFYVHPSEASHGDLGMITADDLVLALSWSGETAELRALIDYTRRFRVPLAAVTSRLDSALAKAADMVMLLPATDEACPHGLAPTTSTLMQLALGDALAVALLEVRGFTAQQFRVYHPGGQLGAYLKHLSDVMHAGDRLPLARRETLMADAIVTMTEKSLGCIGIVDDGDRLIGIITDGDLRRHARPDLLQCAARDIMTPAPKMVTPDTLVSSAVELLNENKITAVFVVDADEKPVGIVHMHDLLRAGVA